MYIVLGGYLRILGAPSIQSCCTLLISASYHVFFMADIANPVLFVCCCRTWIWTQFAQQFVTSGTAPLLVAVSFGASITDSFTTSNETNQMSAANSQDLSSALTDFREQRSLSYHDILNIRNVQGCAVLQFVSS